MRGGPVFGLTGTGVGVGKTRCVVGAHREAEDVGRAIAGGSFSASLLRFRVWHAPSPMSLTCYLRAPLVEVTLMSLHYDDLQRRVCSLPCMRCWGVRVVIFWCCARGGG